MDAKKLAQIIMLIVALDHLILDAVLLENTTEALLGKRLRLPFPTL